MASIGQRGELVLASADVTETEIRDWCIACLKKMVDDPSIAIGPESSFTEIGLDSATSAYFIVELEEWLGTELEPELVFEYPTIATLAAHVMSRRAGSAADDGG